MNVPILSKILIICGPTATGKTNLALHLIEVLPAEIISADSRQVYRDMDIGTGKDKPKNIKIWAYDLVDPEEDFSVAHFYQYAWKRIKKIWAQYELPIIVGGTGQYLSSLIKPPASLSVKPNFALRQELNKLSVAVLQKKLKKINFDKWQHMNHSDRHNPRRLIRAIEVYSSIPHYYTSKYDSEANILQVGLKAPLSYLDAQINARVLKRIKQGMDTEVEKLMKQYPNWSTPAFSATGYCEWRNYLEGKTNQKEAITLWQTAERQYARRQLTWFKKQPNIHWFDITKPNWQSALVDKVKTWYANSQ